jgi:hypothetical protein
VAVVPVVKLIAELYPESAAQRHEIVEEILSVGVTKAKQYLGEDLLRRKAGMEIHTEEYGTIKIKPKSGKK